MEPDLFQCGRVEPTPEAGGTGFTVQCGQAFRAGINFPITDIHNSSHIGSLELVPELEGNVLNCAKLAQTLHVMTTQSENGKKLPIKQGWIL